MTTDRQARRFFVAYGQSSLGTGAAYVALLLAAYARFHSPWALTLVLLAEFAPPMFVGPIFGAAVDRWSRQGCAVVADGVRAAAFLGIALTPSFPLTVALALVAGSGTALYKPAIMAALPEMFGRARLSQATALYGALTEVGYTVGPGLAAVTLLFGGPRLVLYVNAGTFAISAAVLATLACPYRERATASGERKSLLREARDGLGVVVRAPAALTAIVSTSTIFLFAGMANVAEVLLARQLGGGRAGYPVFVAVAGVGVALGSLSGASAGTSVRGLSRRFLAGIVLATAGMFGTAAAPSFALALPPLAAIGVGNGMLIVYERLLIQRTVSGAEVGRAFGSQVALEGFAFGASFLVGGALLTLASPRTLFVIGGVGAALVWVVARQVFAVTAREAEAPRRAAQESAAPEAAGAGASQR